MPLEQVTGRRSGLGPSPNHRAAPAVSRADDSGKCRPLGQVGRDAEGAGDAAGCHGDVTAGLSVTADQLEGRVTRGTSERGGHVTPRKSVDPLTKWNR